MTHGNPFIYSHRPVLPPLTIFDVETTGLDPRNGHRIIEIAGVRMENGVILEQTPFVTFVNPEREIPWEAQRVNKISDAELKDAPTIDLVLPQFLEFAKGTSLVAHNASFDMSFLEAEKQFCWGYTDLPECFCTMLLSRNLYPRDFGHSLDAVSKRLLLPFPEGRHRALADAILAAQALKKMTEIGKLSFEDLRKRAALKAFAKTN